MDHYQRLRHDTEPLRTKVMQHPVYSTVRSVRNLQIFMEHHVFAVWDFMSLLKRLQQTYTCVTLPWYPKPHSLLCRFINDIVLGEESDEDGAGGYASHFELYRSAMTECGASTAAIDGFVDRIANGQSVAQSLRASGAQDSVRSFVETTWSFLNSNQSHCIAAAFTFGREDVIPDMFRNCVASLAEQSAARFEMFRYYLARHIDLDETTHAPMAIKVIHELCGNDATKWQEATNAVVEALQARISLWDGIVAQVEHEGCSQGQSAMAI